MVNWRERVGYIATRAVSFRGIFAEVHARESLDFDGCRIGV